RVWEIDTLIDGGAASNVPLPVSPTVSFDDAGAVQIFTACNSGSGSYTRQADQLRLSGIMYGKQPCASSSAAAAEAHIERVLSEGTLAAQIEAARLTVTRGDIGLSATTE
ncbi:MAG TPA: META domain-containing protein, partial [Polyangiaceae bacterium]|nr:META domain-containing protein [Polyangiaceae bacterium]